jgi:hypothetical protein
MKRQFDSIFEINMEPELIQVDGYGMALGIFHHFSIPSNPIEKTGYFLRAENHEKNLTVITVGNRIITLQATSNTKSFFILSSFRSNVLSKRESRSTNVFKSEFFTNQKGGFP